MPFFPYGIKATVVKRTRRTTPNLDGNDVYTDTEFEVSDVVTWPSTSSLVGQGLRIEMRTGDQSTAVASLQALLPPNTDVTAFDAVRIGDVLWEIEGDPSIYISPFTGTNPGVLVRLVRVTG